MSAPTDTIGSSAVAAILGLSPWQSPHEVWARLVGLTAYSDKDTPVMKRGRMMERALLGWREEEYGVTIHRGPPITGEPWRPVETPTWRHSRPDGFAIIEGTVAEGAPTPGSVVDLFEVKTARDFSGWGDEAEGLAGVPPYYAAQVLWQAATTAAMGITVRRSYLLAFCPMREEFRAYTIERDDRREGALTAHIRGWWERHVRDQAMPAIDGSEGAARALLALHRAPRPELREATESERELVEEWRAAKLAVVAAEAAETAAANHVKAAIADARGLAGLADWRPTKGRVSVSVGDIQKKAPALFAQLEAAGLIKTGEPTRTLVNLKE